MTPAGHAAAATEGQLRQLLSLIDQLGQNVDYDWLIRWFNGDPDVRIILDGEWDAGEATPERVIQRYREERDSRR